MPITSIIVTRVVDAVSGDPIPDAAVYVVDDSGRELSLLTNADSEGNINAIVAGRNIKVSFPGYESIIVDPITIMEDEPIRLQPNTESSLSEVIVKSYKKKVAALKKPTNYAVPIALAAASILTFSIWLYKTS